MAFFKWFNKKNNEHKISQDENTNMSLQKNDLQLNDEETAEKITEEVVEENPNTEEAVEENSNTEEFIEEAIEENSNTEKFIEEAIEENSNTEKFIEEAIEENSNTEKSIEEAIEENSNAEESIKEVVEENSNTNEKSKFNFFSKIKQGLSKTRENILKGVEQVLASFTKIDEELFEELEEALIMADIGMDTSLFIISKVKEIVKIERITNVDEIKNVIVRVISEIMEKDCTEFDLQSPSVILVIGVNGVGKTTSIGKLTNYFKEQNKKVILAAADTFRAAAIDQLEVWGERNNVDVIKHQENSDPAAVVFDAIKASKARKADILICDTAGRLHNKKNLMEELKKIYKVIEREHSEAKVEVLLVLDATTGQNALQQAKIFTDITNVTGLILTKLDGTAKGGIIISIKNELNIPVRFIGIGEGALDLRPFEANEFAKALFEN